MTRDEIKNELRAMNSADFKEAQARYKDITREIKKDAKAATIRARALGLFHLELVGRKDSRHAKQGNISVAVRNELKWLRLGEQTRASTLFERFKEDWKKFDSLKQELKHGANTLSPIPKKEFMNALKAWHTWGHILHRELSAHEKIMTAWKQTQRAIEDRPEVVSFQKALTIAEEVTSPAGNSDASEDWHAKLRGIAEGVEKLNADKRKTSKEHERAGRIGGKESAKQRAHGERERKRKLAAAFQRMRREIAAGKSIKQAARDAMRKGEPLLKSNGEPLREDSLVRYFKAAKSKGGA